MNSLLLSRAIKTTETGAEHHVQGTDTGTEHHVQGTDTCSERL
jgi:hypothetical protein